MRVLGVSEFMKPPPNHLLLTAALLLTSAICSFSANQCPNCGNTAVPYPLSTAPSCGDQSYKIRCDAGALLFDTLNNSYPIISINQADQRLVIKPANPLPNICISSDFTYQGIQLNSSLPFNITSHNTVLLLNCSESILEQPLDCSPASLCRLYVNSSRGMESTCKDASICCTFQAGGSPTKHRIRVRDAGCRAYRSFVNLDSSLPVDKWPDPGVEIQWALPQEPVCRSQVDCDGNSTCEPDPNMSWVRRCHCKVGSQWDPIQGICAETSRCQSSGGCEKSKKTALIAGITSGLIALLMVITIATVLYKFKHYKRRKEARERVARDRQEILSADGSKAAKLFTEKEIKKATNNFSKDRLVGAGGYGEVYKGNLDDGTVVAVKCAKLGNTKGTDQLLNEVRILCQVNHRSLVRLLGCCVELGQPILVYEYISNGTLFDHLQSEQGQLSWIHRLQIAYDAAECLSYLHISATPPIYHRDVKSSNILLDDKMIARISDFGLSRLAHSDMSHISTCCQGTIGYLDPEYFRKFQLTDKSDVYSFGVVLLELLTSHKAVDFSRREDDVNLVSYVRTMMKEEKLMEVIDRRLKEKASSVELESMKELALLALDCLEDKRENRPSMKEAAEDIEYMLNFVISEDVKN
ncbi:hypothetical protein JCGZ_01385 [Jatropha curcas]|uniref:Protein kinase domain-containing protein n=2 Tax=Jatropha curcas TaxID=180498 RepID=A0A067LJP0_JATCU|nr:hypothetical protein JCGZ_01385 [Jatropha curcas]